MPSKDKMSQPDMRWMDVSRRRVMDITLDLKDSLCVVDLQVGDGGSYIVSRSNDVGRDLVHGCGVGRRLGLASGLRSDEGERVLGESVKRCDELHDVIQVLGDLVGGLRTDDGVGCDGMRRKHV